MPRKLKTFITNIGFFELALAAPSMKAALEAWGIGHNAFQHGFAKETHDPKIVAAALAKPGVVLRRGVGTTGAFTENAELPKDLWKLTPPKTESPKAKAKDIRAKSKAKAKPAKNHSENAGQAAILSFEKAKAARDAERKKKEDRQEAQREKDWARIERAVAKADEAIERAKISHDEIVAAIAKERDELDRRATKEKTRWDAERRKLEAARDRAAD
jgi:colicin import membrane protein